MNPSVVLPHDWFAKPVPENVQIGARSWLYSSFAFLHYRSQRDCGVRIGHDTGIYNGTFFDLDNDGEVIIGNYCTLVGAIIATNGRVTIGDYSFLAHEVTIADHFAAAPADAAARLERAGGEITIGPNAWIGARSILLPGSRIGEGSIIGAASVVSIQVPSFSIAAGNPARIIGRSLGGARTDPLNH